MFQVSDERQLTDVFKLAEDNLKISVWKYNDKCYLRNNANKYINMLSVNHKEIQMVTLSKLNLTKMNLTLWICCSIDMNLKIIT